MRRELFTQIAIIVNHFKFSLRGIRTSAWRPMTKQSTGLQSARYAFNRFEGPILRGVLANVCGATGAGCSETRMRVSIDARVRPLCVPTRTAATAATWKDAFARWSGRSVGSSPRRVAAVCLLTDVQLFKGKPGCHRDKGIILSRSAPHFGVALTSKTLGEEQWLSRRPMFIMSRSPGRALGQWGSAPRGDAHCRRGSRAP
jgi:hypothetical protein